MIKSRAALSIFILVLIALISWPWWNIRHTRSVKNTNKPVITQVNFEWLKPQLTSYTNILQRPLFNPSRRPLRKPSSDSQNKTNTNRIYAYKYRGLIKDGSRKMLLLEHQGRISQLYQGEIIDGWTLETIEDNAVILSNGERRINLLDKPRYETTRPERKTHWLPSIRDKE